MFALYCSRKKYLTEIVALIFGEYEGIVPGVRLLQKLIQRGGERLIFDSGVDFTEVLKFKFSINYLRYWFLCRGAGECLTEF